MFGFFFKLFESRQGALDDHSVKQINQNADNLDKAEKGNSSWLPPGAVIDMPTDGQVHGGGIRLPSCNVINENTGEVVITIDKAY